MKHDLPISLRLNRSLYHRIQRLAKADDRRVSDWLRIKLHVAVIQAEEAHAKAESR